MKNKTEGNVFLVEYNNDNRTPRDRLSDEFIKELLSDEFPDFENVRNTDRNSCNRGESRIGRSQHNCRPIRVMPTASILPGDNECDTCKSDCECNCEKENDCGCGSCEGFNPPTLHGVPLAMVYSPHQEWENLYEPEVGHSRGTIFKCLDFPFYPVRCSNNEQCRHHHANWRD